MQKHSDDSDLSTFAISTEKGCFFIVKAREFDVKGVRRNRNAANDKMIGEDGDDAVVQELASFVAAMSETNNLNWSPSPGWDAPPL